MPAPGAAHHPVCHAPALVASRRRDLLKPGGLVLPSRAELFVSGIEDREALATAKAAWDVPVGGLTLAPAMLQVSTRTLAVLVRVCVCLFSFACI